MAVGYGGQVLVSETVEPLVRDALPADATLIDLGMHRLRDLADPLRVFQLAHPDLPREFPPLQSLEVFRGNLPVQATSFVGREQELAAVGDAVEAARLVTITGVGGVGKTRLAVQVAADVLPRFADGAWICDLATASDAEALNQIVATTLGVSPRAGVANRDAVAEFLQAKDLLLVLDNCEHLLDAVGALAATLIQRCEGVRMLATSREGLGVDGEQVWPLRSLPVGPSTELFVERARAVKPAFALESGSAAPVAEICGRLDGMPLAIELAAARVVSMSPLEIAQRLDERFRLLTGGRRSAVERHHTLRATVDWSYSLLDDRDRLVFDRLGVFVGGFDSDAAVAVASGAGIEDWDVVDALADLVAKSLVASEDTAEGTTRYEMLETLRHYAREQLDDHADADERRRRHAGHYAAFAEEAGHSVLGPDELVWRARIRAELDNLRAAVTWSLDAHDDADAELGLRIVVGLAVQQGYDPALGIGQWALRALDRVGTTTPARRQVVRAAAAYGTALAGDYSRARDLVTEALHEGVPDDSPWPSYAAYTLAYVQVGTGEPERVLEIVEGVIEELGDRLGPMDLVTLHSVAAPTASVTGDQARAVTHAKQALELGRRTGSPSGIASSLFAYGLTMRTEDPRAARAALEESIALVERGASPVVYGYALLALALLRAEAGEYAHALRALHDALRYAADTANGQLSEQILALALPVLADVGAPELGVTLVPSSLLARAEAAIGRETQTGADESHAALESVRWALGDAGFARARARGEAMSPRETVDYALAEFDRLQTELGAGDA
jgi:predicted ATPase